MLRKILLTFTGLGVASAVTLSLLTIPLLRRLPKPGRVSMDGIATIEDAVEACRHTQLQGCEQVFYAQQLVARKFTYSRLNTWETPSRAFERGMGYCEQQALALKKIKARTWHPWLRPFTHLGSSIENIRRDMAARGSLKRVARSQMNTQLPEEVSTQPA
jgi:hypothetical protein